MSLIQNHVCDNCGKVVGTKDHYNEPKGWFSVNVSKEDEKSDQDYDVEACSVSCLNALLENAKR